MNCLNCGAPVRTDLRVCPYCETPYRFIDTPKRETPENPVSRADVTDFISAIRKLEKRSEIEMNKNVMYALGMATGSVYVNTLHLPNFSQTYTKIWDHDIKINNDLPNDTIIIQEL